MDQRPGADQIRPVKRIQDLPKNAVILTDDEVLNIQTKRLLNWNPSSAVRELKYGSALMAGLTAASAIITNHHFRQKYLLGHVGRLSTYAPTVIVPTVMAAMGHQLFITHNLLLGQIPACEMCLSTRSGLIQLSVGAVYPMLISPLACIALARKYHTYAVPSATQPREVFGMMRQVFPNQGRFLILCALNFFVGMALADRERTCARNTILKETPSSEGFSKEGFH